MERIIEVGHDENNDKLALSVAEAAQLIGIGESVAYKAVRCGQIPSVRIGRRVLVPRKRLEAMFGIDGKESSES